MSIFAISDLHLSTHEATNKSMEVFGRRWTDYVLRLENNWRRLVTDADTVIIPGDISWALSLEEAADDLKFLDSLPGRKLLLKGNHDFWWATMKKHDAFFEKHGIKTISFVFNNAVAVEDKIIVGTRGWYHDEDAKGVPDNTDFLKLVNRETLRLKASLEYAVKLKDEGNAGETVAFMHFPPFWNGKESTSMIELLLTHDVKRVYFGHIHGNYTLPPSFEYKGINMSIISADYLGFIPKFIE